MGLTVGTRIAHYESLSPLGAVGKGEVYVARDTKLSRDVALKVLPTELASPERRKRFEREAKAIAALNHPNIVHVYSVEGAEADGISFITMELVKGKTLAQLLPRNGFPLAKFFEIAIPPPDQVASEISQLVHPSLHLLSGDATFLDFSPFDWTGYGEELRSARGGTRVARVVAAGDTNAPVNSISEENEL